jgi:UDP-N-acetylmuramate dehydrogenase
MLAHILPRLIDRLPVTRGEIKEQADLSAITWFRTGGRAEILYRPADIEDLGALLKTLDPDIELTVLGLGSNVLIRDGGVPGFVINLGKAVGLIEFDGNDVIAGAGALDVAVSRACRDRNLGGLEFLNGIPGTIGGALRMNAGAYGREISDVLVSAQALDLSGQMHEIPALDFGFSYRHTNIDPSWIFVSARLRATPANREDIDRKMAKIGNARRSSQPAQARTGGSTFKNPPGRKAWELIDQAGCRGLTVGDAQVSEQHCNFLINLGNASASDLETLGEEVRRRVEENSGFVLEWEIRRIGIPAGETA